MCPALEGTPSPSLITVIRTTDNVQDDLLLAVYGLCYKSLLSPRQSCIGHVESKPADASTWVTVW